MEKVGKLRASLLVAVLLAAVLTATLLVTRSGNASGNAKTRAVVKTAMNKTLGKKILVTRSGLTLYSLSAERHGRFICTAMGCTSIWKPLVVPAGIKPTGVSGLATVKRPTGQRQVAYHGAPLYHFVQDTKPGQVKGNGFRDVGVWRPVAVGARAAQAPAPMNTGGSSNPYSY
jgi:predicted lipoprotein with Yx(FWY)xxD motif